VRVPARLISGAQSVTIQEEGDGGLSETTRFLSPSHDARQARPSSSHQSRDHRGHQLFSPVTGSVSTIRCGCVVAVGSGSPV
jgi:hypothetical protein